MYINTQTNQYPISEQEIKSAYPNTSFPSPFNPPDGYQWVFPAPQPTHTPIIETVREIAPVLINGHYEQRWKVVDVFKDYLDEDDVLHTKQDQETAALAAVEKAKVPISVDMRQARLALLSAGMLSQADSAIAAMTGIEGDAARIDWEYATTVRRDNPLVVGMASVLGLTEIQLDQLFIAASKII